PREVPFVVGAPDAPLPGLTLGPCGPVRGEGGGELVRRSERGAGGIRTLPPEREYRVAAPAAQLVHGLPEVVMGLRSLQIALGRRYVSVQPVPDLRDLLGNLRHASAIALLDTGRFDRLKLRQRLILLAEVPIDRREQVAGGRRVRAVESKQYAEAFLGHLGGVEQAAEAAVRPGEWQPCVRRCQRFAGRGGLGDRLH